MDEPFAAVDAQTRMTLQEELNRIYEQEKNTILFVTHSVEEAIFLATRIIFRDYRQARGSSACQGSAEKRFHDTHSVSSWLDLDSFLEMTFILLFHPE
jgi:ABC-type nitrate/sulfonate/bicarbonate transport system ATPase subunit